MTNVIEQKKPRRARGEGGLTQIKSGRHKDMWVAQIELPTDPGTGKRRFKKVRSMSQTEAVRKLNKVKRSLADNGDLPTANETLSKWMRYWFENIDQSRPSTRNSYRSLIKRIDESIGNIRIENLTTADVRKLENYIVKTRKRSPTTALQAYRVLSKALKDAQREGHVTRNVASLVSPPRKAAPALAELSASEGVAVIKSVTDERLGSRWAAALLTGARQGELIGLEIDRVDFGTSKLKYADAVIDFSWQLQRINWRHGCGDKCDRKRGTDCPQRTMDAPADYEYRHIHGALYWTRPKSKAGWRVIPLVEPLYSILKRRIAVAAKEPNQHGLVWTADVKKSKGGKSTARKVLPLDGQPLDPARDNHAWHAVLAAAEVTDVRLHDARHAAVTILYDLDVPEVVIQEIVGQSVIGVTRNYKNRKKRSMRPMIEAMEALGGVLNGQLALPTHEIEQ